MTKNPINSHDAIISIVTSLHLGLLDDFNVLPVESLRALCENASAFEGSIMYLVSYKHSRGYKKKNENDQKPDPQDVNWA